MFIINFKTQGGINCNKGILFYNKIKIDNEKKSPYSIH